MMNAVAVKKRKMGTEVLAINAPGAKELVASWMRTPEAIRVK